MRILEIKERTVPISRYSDPRIPSDGLNTTVVAVVTDVHRNGAPVTGFGFSSIGRFGQSGLIRERFAPPTRRPRNRFRNPIFGVQSFPFIIGRRRIPGVGKNQRILTIEFEALRRRLKKGDCL
jgi:hypothetical protein